MPPLFTFHKNSRMRNQHSPFPDAGFGLGLRIPHYAHIFEHTPQVDWFEIISENFMDTDGRAKRNLARIREHYPIVMPDQDAMKDTAHQVIGECARARKIALGEVSLPIHPYLTEMEIDRVIEVCNRWGG